MNGILNDILEMKRREVARPSAAVEKPPPSDRDFVGALRHRSRAIIAELKRRSPSEGVLCDTYRPATVAADYERGGAAALSVLTDSHYFGGCTGHLTEVRAATQLPMLRKDFIIDSRQVVQSRAAGADACLLIAAALSSSELVDLIGDVRRCGMTPLVEVHSEGELEAAVAAGGAVIGVNSRNLSTMEIDPEVIHRLVPLVPEDVVLIAESGIGTPEQAASLPDRVNGVLIGTALMRSSDPVEFLREANRRTERVA